MLKVKIFVSIFVSVIAMILFETTLNGFLLPAGASSPESSGILKYFIPSIIAAIVVAMPMAINFRPESLKVCVSTALIWVSLDLFLLYQNADNTLGSLEHVFQLTIIYGPKLAALVIFILTGYVADKKFANR